MGEFSALGLKAETGGRERALRELLEAGPTLIHSFLINGYHPEVDAESRAIGAGVCSLFCSHEDTDQIHEFLGTGS